MDLRVPMGPALTMFSVAATVTLADETPISTRLIWHPPVRRQQTDEVYEITTELRRRQAERKVVSLPRSDVPSAPPGTRIAAPEVEGGPVLDWIVDVEERRDAEDLRVVVLADPDSA